MKGRLAVGLLCGLLAIFFVAGICVSGDVNKMHHKRLIMPGPMPTVNTSAPKLPRKKCRDTIHLASYPI